MLIPVLASVLFNLLAIGFILVCGLLILVVLIQKPKGGGLSGAFGGAGGGSAQAAFGAKVGDFLTWATVGLFAGFLLLAMGLTWTAVTPELPEEPEEVAETPGAGGIEIDPESDLDADFDPADIPVEDVTNPAEGPLTPSAPGAPVDDSPGVDLDMEVDPSPEAASPPADRDAPADEQPQPTAPPGAGP